MCSNFISFLSNTRRDTRACDLWRHFTIYDVISASGELIGTYCDDVNLYDLVSDSTSMHVVFDSDGSSTSGGFRIYYKEVSSEYLYVYGLSIRMCVLVSLIFLLKFWWCWRHQPLTPWPWKCCCVVISQQLFFDCIIDWFWGPWMFSSNQSRIFFISCQSSLLRHAWTSSRRLVGGWRSGKQDVSNGHCN